MGDSALTREEFVARYGRYFGSQRGVIAVASSQNLAVPKLYPPLILEDKQIAEFAEKADATLKSLQGPAA